MHIHWPAEDSHFIFHAIKNIIYYSESALKLLQLYEKNHFFVPTYFHNNQLYRYIFSDNYGKLEKNLNNY